MLCLSSLLQLLRPASWVPAGIVAVVWIHQTGEHRSCGRTRRGNKFETSGLLEPCRRQVTDRRKCKFVLLEANHFSAAKINLRLNNMPAKQISWGRCMGGTIMRSCNTLKSNTFGHTKSTKEVPLYTSSINGRNSFAQIRSLMNGPSLGDSSSSSLANSSL